MTSTPIWTDPRVIAGFGRMLRARDQRLEAGERRLGWKVAFGPQPAQDRLAISAPLAGFLLDASLLDSGSTVTVDGWKRPAIEPEIAVHLAADVPAEASEDEIAAAIGGLGVAIEVLDFDSELLDVEAILAGDIFQRHVILGEPRTGVVPADVRVAVDGAELHTVADPTTTVGRLTDVLAGTAALLGGFGERLQAGDVVITGSATPLVHADAGQRVDVEIPALGSLSVAFA